MRWETSIAAATAMAPDPSSDFAAMPMPWSDAANAPSAPPLDGPPRRDAEASLASDVVGDEGRVLGHGARDGGEFRLARQSRERPSEAAHRAAKRGGAAPVDTDGLGVLTGEVRDDPEDVTLEWMV
ncbi:MAG: hypothetical protein R6W79_08615, partial [Acidimicrobiia bacterium]